MRVLLFLSLALLPIGLIAISQTQQIARDNRASADVLLLAATEQASSAERAVLQTAFSTASALVPIVELMHTDTERCSEFMRAYQRANSQYSLVGFIRTDGRMQCSSADNEFNFSDSEGFRRIVDEQKLRATALQNGAYSQRPVTVVSIPIRANSDTTGFLSVSIPSDTFDRVVEPDRPMKPLALITFNEDGEILTTERGLDLAGSEVPKGRIFEDFVGEPPSVVFAPNQKGVERVYSIMPLVPGAVHAAAVWPTTTPFLNPGFLERLTAFLPVAMWAASLIVAFWALNRLAIRHIRKLGRQMRRFAINRNLPRKLLGNGVPFELVEMEAAFISMGESILRDEATLEDSLREKNILLKEVHHRVKNNLQMISSIMNMQIRQAKTEDSKLVLRRLQERILSLATVHKNLYQTDELVRVDVAVLLKEVVNQLLSVGLAPGSNVDVKQSYVPLSIEADDAAPLTLLVSEAMTNALKHICQDGRSESRIEIELVSTGPESARLSLINSKGGETDEAGTGLGSRLIEAFARQLNGQVEVTETEDSYEMVLTFPVPQSNKPTYDY
ncbi:Sensor histidine kinase [Sulfitobacter noctilucicola]|uniref:histidine kinase n=1 Tax=Sulfitobacter noctilucicola TaxID=1342301 RepID=A0A7W6M502_9RHOB|nr:sensor histidine kinase [Sulfitobacter noctilucicola]KIN62943.1 Sensor histidine kinase [Sulfitobacter noctilucicola]MBB4172529.1 two-component sensor histidine kinase [Sulfitobacter noctilucicola]